MLDHGGKPVQLLQERTAIVTGGGTPDGIGRATARLFAEHGARVAILDIEATDPAAAAAEIGLGRQQTSSKARDPKKTARLVPATPGPGAGG